MIPVAEPSIGEVEIAYVQEAVRSGWVSSKGEFIERFEQEWARYCGCRSATTTCNGTAALHLALRALGIGVGDEVIVPALTFGATWNAVVHAGATPVFVDSHPEHWCLDENLVEEAVTPLTRAIIVVHLYGHPAEMDKINEIARAHSLFVIEDAAEAHGAEYRGSRVGGLGTVGVFSFYGNKTITTGEGGALVSNDVDLIRRAVLWKNHGMSPNRRYWHEVPGFNYRLTNLQAALGLAQLKRIDEFLDRKRAIVDRYRQELADCGAISVASEKAWAKSSFWMASIVVEELGVQTRDGLLSHMEAHRVEARPFFYPGHLMPGFAARRPLPVAEHLSRTGMNLPSGVNLSAAEVSFVCKTIKDYLRAA